MGDNYHDFGAPRTRGSGGAVFMGNWMLHALLVARYGVDWWIGCQNIKKFLASSIQQMSIAFMSVSPFSTNKCPIISGSLMPTTMWSRIRLSRQFSQNSQVLAISYKSVRQASINSPGCWNRMLDVRRFITILGCQCACIWRASMTLSGLFLSTLDKSKFISMRRVGSDKQERKTAIW